MSQYISSFINAVTSTISGFIWAQDPVNVEQPNLPLPQPIEEVANPLYERAVEVVRDAPETVSNSIGSILPSLEPESITCTPEEFKRLLAENYRFPSKIIVIGALNFNCDHSLITLPAGMEVRGNLNLSGCTSLTSVPEGLVVIGHLYLTRCGASLTFLPAGMKVYGHLNLSGCTSLTSLPEGLVVHEDLVLFGCTSLTSLPEDLVLIYGDVCLSECASLTSLPSWITTLGANPDGTTRIVDLTNTGLSDAIIERLRQTPAPGMQFRFSHAATNSTIQFPNVETALCFWFKEAKDETLAIPNIAFDREQESANVTRFLARLTTTAEYKNLQTRQHLAGRILEVFNQMSQDEAIKGAACELIHEGLTSCDDRIISALEEIELMLLLHKIEKTHHTAEELKKLGKSFLLLEMVNAKAKAHKETLTWVDEIEIYLAFQIGLADRFDLPVKTRNMFFRECAQVTTDQLNAFGDEIERECTDEKLEAFLQTWSPWIKFQKQAQVIPAYDDLPVADRELAEDDTCAMTLCAPDQPVLYNGHVYDYDSFIYQCRTNGTDPLDRSKIDISQLKRIKK